MKVNTTFEIGAKERNLMISAYGLPGKTIRPVKIKQIIHKMVNDALLEEERRQDEVHGIAGRHQA